MEGLFSFLGKYGKKEVLLCEDKERELENLIPMLFPENMEIKEPITDPEVLADKIIDMCEEYLNFIPAYNEKYAPFFKDAENIWKESIKYFEKAIRKDLITDLKYLMIASWRYTVSLKKSPVIINGTNDNPSFYIAEFDFEGARKNNGKGRTEIRKLIQNSRVALNKKDKGEIKFSKKMSLTVLPQFIRRYSDMGIDLTDNENLDEKAEGWYKKVPIVSSIFDVGPVLGLLNSSKPKNNPYIIDPSTEGKIKPSADVDDETFSFVNDVISNDNSDNTEHSTDSKGFLITNEFVRSFISAPISVLPQETSTFVLSTSEVLDNINKIAKGEKTDGLHVSKEESKETIDFLKSISPEELAVFDQYAIERFTHACYLQAIYNTEMKLSRNIFEYAMEEVKAGIKAKHASRTKDYNEKEINNILSDENLFKIEPNLLKIRDKSALYSVQIVGEYLKDTCCYTSFLSLPLTRLAMVNAMLDLNAFNYMHALDRKRARIISKIEILMQLYSIYLQAIKKLIDFYLYVTVPISILTFHYYANKMKEIIEFDNESVKQFFKKYISCYDFYKYDNETNLSVNDELLKRYGFEHVEPDKNSKIFDDKYIKWFYKHFYISSLFAARGGLNIFNLTVQRFTEVISIKNYVQNESNKLYCQEMYNSLFDTFGAIKETAFDDTLKEIGLREKKLRMREEYIKKGNLEGAIRVGNMTDKEFIKYVEFKKNLHEKGVRDDYLLNFVDLTWYRQNVF